MARYRKPTMRETIASLEREARSERERAETLWRALDAATVPLVALAASLADGNPAKRPVLAALGKAHEALSRTVRCSCGRYASMWAGGEGPKMCETCMST